MSTNRSKRNDQGKQADMVFFGSTVLLLMTLEASHPEAMRTSKAAVLPVLKAPEDNKYHFKEVQANQQRMRANQPKHQVHLGAPGQMKRR